MAIENVVDLLACPQCGQRVSLVPGDRSVRCGSGHVFDIARQGYLNLAGRREPRNADTVAMLGARDRFLAGGHYQPVADRLAALVCSKPKAASRLLDVGTGTGYYLGRLLDRLPHARGIGLDVSVAAARRAARAHPRLGAVVADAWQGLPVTGASIDVLLNVFAPRNAAEFGRVLAPEGVLLTVTPEPDHLHEARHTLGLLDIQPAKHEQLRTTMGARLVEVSTETVRYPCRLDGESVRDLVAMGPNAFHLGQAEIAARAASVPDPFPVTVAVDLTLWAPGP